MFQLNYDIVKSAVCSVVLNNSVGTGWFYRRRSIVSRSSRNTPPEQIFVVTAAHVILDNNNQIVDPEILVNGVNGTTNNHIFRTKVISIDKKGDIALLEILNHRGGESNNKYPLNWPNHRTLNVTNVKQKIGIPIFIVGYPLGWDYNSFAAGYLRENNASESYTPKSLFYDMSTYGGNSGSPVLNTNNDVIGMLQWGLQDSELLNGGISGDILFDFLETSIDRFVKSGRTNYYQLYKKNYIPLSNFNSFQPLNGEVISLFNKYNLALQYKDGGRNIDGVILLAMDQTTRNFNYTYLVLERILYTDKFGKSKLLRISSSIYDKDNIWDIYYFAKPQSEITLYFYNIESNEETFYKINLTEMPDNIDMFLTNVLEKQNNNNINNLDTNTMNISTNTLIDDIHTNCVVPQ